MKKGEYFISYRIEMVDNKKGRNPIYSNKVVNLETDRFLLSFIKEFETSIVKLYYDEGKFCFVNVLNIQLID